MVELDAAALQAAADKRLRAPPGGAADGTARKACAERVDRKFRLGVGIHVGDQGRAGDAGNLGSEGWSEGEYVGDYDIGLDGSNQGQGVASCMDHGLVEVERLGT